MSVLDPRVVGIIKALRAVPEISEVMADRTVSISVYRNLLAADLQMPLPQPCVEHELQDCRRAVLDAGLVITKPKPSRAPDPADKPKKAWDDRPPSFTKDTQNGKLLLQFYAAGDDGLTDDVATELADLNGASSPWRRSSTLRALGLISYCYDESGELITRHGHRGVLRSVSAITDEGIIYTEKNLF
jgi:hypothetical protein